MSRSKDNRAENITDLRQLRKERSRRRAWKRLGIFLGILLGAWLVVSGVQGFFSGTYIEDINSFLAMYLPGDGFPVEPGLGSNHWKLASITEDSLWPKPS